MMRLATLALWVALTAACGQQAAEPTHEADPRSTDQTPTPPTATPGDKAAGAAIIYQRSGGIAGLVEEWRIYPDGRVVSAEGKEHEVPPQEVSALLVEIEALGFFEMRDPGGLSATCADCFSHEITVSSGGKLNRITVAGGNYDPQDPRWQIVQKISDFVSALPVD